MAPRSKVVTELTDEAKVELDRRLATGRHTLDELVGWLDELGFKISRSSLGRYSQEFEAVTEDIRATRELAKAVGRELEDMADGDATTVVVESLHALIFKVRRQLLQDPDALNAKAVADLAKAAKDLSTALGLRAAMEMKIRVEVEKAVKKEAATAAEKVARERGLSADTIGAIKAQILGVKAKAAAQ